MQKRLLILLCLLITVTAQAQDDVIDQLPAFVEHGMAQWHVPGMAVAVVTDKEVLLQQGFGSTADKGGTRVDSHTLFSIASTTKAMVAAAILILVEEKQLALDDLAIKHLPELQFGDSWLNDQITIRDLLTHRTGLASTDFWTFAQGMALKEQITHLQKVEATASLRSRFQYQNTMFELLGLIIERLSGEPWQDFIKQRVWQPIGMQETFASRGRIPNGMEYVLPHRYIDKQVVQAEWDLDAMAADAAGSVWSSIADMSKWAQFLLRGGETSAGQRLLSKASIAEMFKPQMLISTKTFYPTTKLTEPHWLSYGLGWFQQDFQGRKIDFHTGSLSGLIAIVGLDRQARRAVIVLGNQDHAEMRHAILWQVMDVQAAGKRRDWNADILSLYGDLKREGEAQWEKTVKARLPDSALSLPLADYTGTYRSAAYGDVQVVQEDDQFLMRGARFYLPLSHWHLDTFLAERKDLEFKFLLPFSIGSNGKVRSVEFFRQVFEKVNEEKD